MKSIFGFFFLCLMAACTSREATSVDPENVNPGFDVAGSDPAAIELADSIIQAMGGAESWQAVRYMTWTHQGRTFYWDKQLAKARMESGDTIALLDLSTKTGQVQINSQTADIGIDPFLSIWHHEIFDLIIPYEIKNSGATITYMGEDTLRGQRFNSLVLTFRDRPDQYKFYVDKHKKLVLFSAHYDRADQVQQNYLHGWDNYQQVGAALFSFDRSDGTGPQDVSVEESLPESLFTEF